QLTVVWHHGTPNVGTPPTPLFAAAARHRIRWLAYDPPRHGGSPPPPRPPRPPSRAPPPPPLSRAPAPHRIRWLAYDRPGYGGSPPHPGRTVGDAAAHTAPRADAPGAHPHPPPRHPR